MLGVNCTVIGCGSCSRTEGIGIFKLSSAKDDKHKRWRDKWVGELKKTREVGKDFRRQINEDKVYTCEKHFKDELIEIPYLPLYNAHFFPAEKAQKIEMRIIHGILCFRLASLISM